jgi:cellulose synthase/poly-beta-1,6-N-acetylglucosamine synthase-like glycosyltransferase
LNVVIVSCALVLLALAVCIPVVVLAVEVIAAVGLPGRRSARELAGRPEVAVLVPAHNESAGLLPTLSDIKSQLHPRDRIVVVADNCTDDTANVAAAAGAEVVERKDLTKIGKGYALDCGLRHLRNNPPPVVIAIDADCRLSPGTIDQLARTAATSGRPAQALNLMTRPDTSQVNYQVAEFAWRVKNLVRPLGLAALGLPCQLLGTGMAFPWQVIQGTGLASGEVVEDLKLGLDLAAAGHPPIFCPAATITSTFPQSEAGARHQRERWEHGHLALLLTVGPRLACMAVRRGDARLLALVADLAVPPLSALAMLVVSTVVITALAALLGAAAAPFWIAVLGLMLFGLAVVIGWLAHGREILPLGALIRLGPYLLEKLRIYRRFLSGARASRWIRTDRT